jgi:hypothetical protein
MSVMDFMRFLHLAQVGIHAGNTDSLKRLLVTTLANYLPYDCIEISEVTVLKKAGKSPSRLIVPPLFVIVY